MIYSRNAFLKLLLKITGGITIGTYTFEASSCKSDLNGGNGYGVNGYSFGSGDIAALNFLYVVEQVQYYFYKNWISSGINGFTSQVQSLIIDISLHQFTHFQFFNIALGTNGIPLLELNFTSINFSNQASILETAVQFQNMEVEAYIGISSYFQSSSFLVISQKIASLEARHASFISNLNQSGSFYTGSVLNSLGFENSQTPAQILTFYKPYIKTLLDTSTLPT